jgi:hypothetical protein
MSERMKSEPGKLGRFSGLGRAGSTQRGDEPSDRGKYPLPRARSVLGGRVLKRAVTSLAAGVGGGRGGAGASRNAARALRC